MTIPILIDVSVPRGNDLDLEFSVPEDDVSLAGARVLWNVYGESFAVPVRSPVLVVKDSDISGEVIVVPSPGSFSVRVLADDTADLPLGNYYHEGEVISESGGVVTVVRGTLSVTLSVIPS